MKKSKTKSKGKSDKAWREHKQIKRDKAKREYIWGRYFRDGPAPWFKRLNNKRIRRLQKKLLWLGEESYGRQNFKKYSKEWWT